MLPARSAQLVGMGISGLHSVVRPYLRDTHLSAYKGERVGCDAYAWLHRGACVWAAQLAEGLTQQSRTGTPPWLEFCINMVKMLLNLEVIPVVSPVTAKKTRSGWNLGLFRSCCTERNRRDTASAADSDGRRKPASQGSNTAGPP